MTSALLLCALLAPDEAADALKKFDAAYKSKDAAARAAAVVELSKVDHEKVIAKLEKLLVVDAKEVRIAAAKGLGVLREDRDRTKKATNALAKSVGPNYAEPSVIVAIVEALEAIQETLGISVLHQHFAHPTGVVAKGAVEAAALLRKKESVPLLIQLVKLLEAAAREATNVGPGGSRPVVGGGIPGTGGVPDAEAPKREKTVKPASLSALEKITGKSFKTVREWDEWWKKEGADFRVP